MIEEYDKAQEELREEMRGEIEERNMQAEEYEERIEISVEESAVRTEMLTSESLTTEDDNHELHIMWATDEGIFCRKAGQTEGYEWSIPFTEAGQRDMVEALMRRLPKERTGLAADASIWERYLKGELSMDEIVEEIES